MGLQIIGLKNTSALKSFYFGKVMVDHCPTEKLLKLFAEFVEKACLSTKLMLNTRMNGFTVNLPI